MAPAPHSIPADLEESCRRCIATESHFEQQIVLAAGEPALEARWRYRTETIWHGELKRYLHCPRRQIFTQALPPNVRSFWSGYKGFWGIWGVGYLQRKERKRRHKLLDIGDMQDMGGIRGVKGIKGIEGIGGIRVIFRLIQQRHYPLPHHGPALINVAVRITHHSGIGT